MEMHPWEMWKGLAKSHHMNLRLLSIQRAAQSLSLYCVKIQASDFWNQNRTNRGMKGWYNQQTRTKTTHNQSQCHSVSVDEWICSIWREGLCTRNNHEIVKTDFTCTSKCTGFNIKIKAGNWDQQGTSHC